MSSLSGYTTKNWATVYQKLKNAQEHVRNTCSQGLGKNSIVLMISGEIFVYELDRAHSSWVTTIMDGQQI